MKFSLFFLTTLLSTSAFSAVDYSYCQKQFNTFVQSNKPCKAAMMGMFTMCGGYGSGTEKNADNSFYPFELSADGKIVPHPTMNYKNEDGKEIIYSKNRDMDYETIITRNEKGEISGVSTNYVAKTQMVGAYGGIYGYPATQMKTKQAQFLRKNETNTKIEIKNGKCIPSRIDTVNSLGDESRQDVSFDANLCRNVSEFFKKNPEAASCFDKGLMEKAQGIFNDFYKNNKDIYGDANPNDPINKPKPLRTKMKSDMNRGMYGGGYGYPGTGGMGGMGIGMGMGMPGASVDQMLTPMMPSMDSVLSSPGFGLGGFGNSTVVQAMQVMSLCQGGGFGPSVTKDIVNDDSIWMANSQDASGSNAALTTPK